MLYFNHEKKIPQSNLSTVLGRLLTGSKFNTTAFAKEINLPPPTIHRILNGEVQDPRASTLILIADYFDISVDQLLGKKPLECIGISEQIAKPSSFSIPVLSLAEAKECEIHLNSPTSWLRWQNQNHTQKYITQIFSVLLKNTIYDPSFLNGTHLIVNRELMPISGDFVLVKFHNDPAAVIKKYFSEGQQKYLYPLKQDLKSISFDGSECNLIGVIIESYLKLKY